MASNIRVKAGARRANGRGRAAARAAGETAAAEATTDTPAAKPTDAPPAKTETANPPPRRTPAPPRANKRPPTADADDEDDGNGRISRMDKLRQADRKLKQAEMLLNVSRRVAAIESLDEVLETMVEMTTWELQAERGTLFLNDPVTDELYSRFAQGNFQREIRIMNNSGIAGAVFQSGDGLIILDAYSDERFNRTVDEQTGFTTKSILCAPVRTVKGELIGVIQVLNKKKGEFTDDDLALLEAMTTQASVALQSTQFVEKMKKSREQELEFLDIVTDVTSDLELGSLLAKVMTEATRMLNADRGTLFINDEKNQRVVLARRHGRQHRRNPPAEYRGDRGCGVLVGQVGQHSIRLCRSALQSELR